MLEIISATIEKVVERNFHCSVKNAALTRGGEDADKTPMDGLSE